MLDASQFAVYDARVLVLNLPDGEELDAINAVLATFCKDFAGNDGWAELAGPSGACALWRGWIPGGIAGAYVALRSSMIATGLDVVLSDGQIDVIASGGADEVVVSGVLRWPLVVSEVAFHDLAMSSMTPEELTRGLHRLGFAAGDQAATETPRPSPGEETQMYRRPARLEVTPPGQVDWCFLEEPACTISDEYDEEGNLEDARAIFGAGSLTTVIVPPGISEAFAGDHESSFRWRVLQYDDEIETDPSGFELITVSKALEVLPDDARDWVKTRSERALDLAAAWLDEADGDDEDLRAEHDLLRAEVAAAFG